MSPLTKKLQEITERCEKANQPLPGYFIDRDGKVYSFGHKWRGHEIRELKQIENSHGYLRFKATIDGVLKTYMTHKMVLEIYVGKKPSEDHQVCHINGIRTDNRIENLYWGTAKDNAADRTRHGNCKAAINGRKSSLKLTGTGVGAYFDKRRNVWTSACNVNGKRKYLGSYKTANDASKAYRDYINKQLEDILEGEQ